MKDLPDRSLELKSPAGNLDNIVDSNQIGTNTEQKSTANRPLRASFLASVLASTLSIFETRTDSSSVERKAIKSRGYGWTAAVRKIMNSSSMWRLQERWLGTSRAQSLSSTSEIWLLGKPYRLTLDESAVGTAQSAPENSYADFLEDYSSRIWITYRKGFDAISDSKFTSDANWGCMIRSSQMIVAQALMFHHLGRAWRKPLQKPYDPRYIEILNLFGDSEAHAFSIHNLLQAGRTYGLAAGSWLGPYAMCRTWETLARTNKEQADQGRCKESLPMSVYIVSGDEDGERGGAPVVCVDVAAKLCSDFGKGQETWAPILLLVPLVLGLEKVNPRYIPLLQETFTFPQSLGILGGKPGTSTYIVGVQDDKAFYLDPHEVQPVVDIKKDDLEADTSSYHCSTVRHLPLELIDPSLAIGFYCRDKDDFDDFCARASQLGDKSNGTPLFTVVQFIQPTKPLPLNDALSVNLGAASNKGIDDNLMENFNYNGAQGGEDEWQIL